MAQNGKRKGEDAFLLGLATGQSVRDAAKTAGIGERTAHRRCDDPAFWRRLSACRARLVEQALGKLTDAASAAVDTLVKLLKSKSASIRLGAARAILDQFSRLRENVELAARIEELEALMEDRNNGNPR